MSLQQTLQVFELLDSASVSGQDVADLFSGYPGVCASVKRVSGPKGQTDFVRITLAGSAGKSRGGLLPPWGLSAVWAALAHGQRVSAWCRTPMVRSLPSAVR